MKFSELKYLYAELKNPGAEFRSLPFWAWNSRMQHDELRRQIQDMRDKGLGGSFIHSRDGLETPYLSDEWLEDVGAILLDMMGACYGLRPMVCERSFREPVTDEKISGWNNPWFRCETEIGDCTSPRDMITMLRALHDGTLLGREASDRMLALMKPNPARARIGKYLPVGVTVCRKTGTLHRGLCNDAGIVYTPKGDYALMIFYNGNLGTQEEYDSPLLNVRCDELLARISKAVYEIYMEA